MRGTGASSRERLLVLGAGRAQVGVLRAARARDLFVIACERDPGAPGFHFADRRAIVSRLDETAVGRLAVAERVDAVIATGNEPTLAIASRLSERLGLPLAQTADVADLLASGRRQQEALAFAGIPRPRWLELERVDVSVTALTIGGCFYPLAVTDRFNLEWAHRVPASAHVWPSEHADDACLEIARRATEALGVRDGAVRIDLMLTCEDPQVVAVRPGCAGEPEEDLCAAALGVDLHDLSLSVSLGEPIEPPSIDPGDGVHACVRLLPDGDDAEAFDVDRPPALAHDATREAALQRAIAAALRVRFRQAGTPPSFR